MGARIRTWRHEGCECRFLGASAPGFRVESSAGDVGRIGADQALSDRVARLAQPVRRMFVGALIAFVFLGFLRMTSPFPLRKSALGAAALPFGAASPAAAQSAQVTLDIQGRDFTGTIPITTGPRPVFDGTLCDAGSDSSTPITALVDASDKFEFNVQSRYDQALKDFVVTAIDVDEADSAHRWNIYVYDALVTNGGCHTAVTSGDKINSPWSPYRRHLSQKVAGECAALGPPAQRSSPVSGRQTWHGSMSGSARAIIASSREMSPTWSG